MRVVLAAGNTRTALVDGLSAAVNRERFGATPAADAELLAYGAPIRAPDVPVSPEGVPTPAVVTRAVRELVGFELAVLDAGLAAPTAAPTVDVHAATGGDVREPEPVPGAASVLEAGRTLGAGLPAEELVLAETIPGGTTTALGVFAALGEPHGVASSRPTNPIERKRAVVAAGLEASGLDRGDAAGEPAAACRAMGDPALAVLAGVARGALERDARVTLAGGTQLLAVAALVRHAGLEAPMELATTRYLADAPAVDLEAAGEALDLAVSVTDPGFDRLDGGLGAYADGVAKEGAGMGGALALARRADVPMARVRERTIELLARLRGDADGA